MVFGSFQRLFSTMVSDKEHQGLHSGSKGAIKQDELCQPSANMKVEGAHLASTNQDSKQDDKNIGNFPGHRPPRPPERSKYRLRSTTLNYDTRGKPDISDVVDSKLRTQAANSRGDDGKFDSADQGNRHERFQESKTPNDLNTTRRSSHRRSDVEMADLANEDDSDVADHYHTSGLHGNMHDTGDVGSPYQLGSPQPEHRIRFLEQEYTKLRQEYIKLSQKYGHLQLINEQLKHHQVQALHGFKELHKTDQKNIAKLERRLEEVQSEAFSRVDKFQPGFDEGFVAQFNNLDQSMKPVLTMLSKEKPNLSPKSWTRTIQNMMATEGNGKRFELIDVSDKTTRKKVLRAVVWKWLEHHFFTEPFQAFDGTSAEALKFAYQNLWKDPSRDEDAAKWKALSCARLIATSEDDKTNIYEARLKAVGSFDEVCNTLGFPRLNEINDGEKKVSSMVDVGILLSRSFATQRAAFELWWPPSTSKASEEESLTTVDAAFGEDDEHAGQVAFISRPGLVKRGTGKGGNLHEQTFLVKAIVQLE